MEEFQDYQRDKWWWFVAYLEMAASISADPKLSAKNSNFSDLITDFNHAVEQFEVQKSRSVLFNHGINDE